MLHRTAPGLRSTPTISSPSGPVSNSDIASDGSGGFRLAGNAIVK
jgi:hypothetical protein